MAWGSPGAHGAGHNARLAHAPVLPRAPRTRAGAGSHQHVAHQPTHVVATASRHQPEAAHTRAPALCMHDKWLRIYTTSTCRAKAGPGQQASTAATSRWPLLLARQAHAVGYGQRNHAKPGHAHHKRPRGNAGQHQSTFHRNYPTPNPSPTRVQATTSSQPISQATPHIASNWNTRTPNLNPPKTPNPQNAPKSPKTPKSPKITATTWLNTLPGTHNSTAVDQAL